MEYLFEKPVIATIGAEKYQTTIEWGHGEFIVDEPEKIGGKNLGPDPYTLILSALGACTLATLRMYIDRKGWDIPKMTVALNMYKTIEDGNPVTVIVRDLDFISPITSEQCERLVQIAKVCPVSKLLEAGVKVHTTAKFV